MVRRHHGPAIGNCRDLPEVVLLNHPCLRLIRTHKANGVDFLRVPSGTEKKKRKKKKGKFINQHGVEIKYSKPLPLGFILQVDVIGRMGNGCLGEGKLHLLTGQKIPQCTV